MGFKKGEFWYLDRRINCFAQKEAENGPADDESVGEGRQEQCSGKGLKEAGSRGSQVLPNWERKGLCEEALQALLEGGQSKGKVEPSGD